MISFRYRDLLLILKTCAIIDHKTYLLLMDLLHKCSKQQDYVDAIYNMYQNKYINEYVKNVLYEYNPFTVLLWDEV